MLAAVLTSGRQRIDAPVAQRIEHLPFVGALMGKVVFDELIKWTTLYAGTPLEPLVLIH